MADILYMPWVERAIENENRRAAMAHLDSENPDVFVYGNKMQYDIIKKLIYRGRCDVENKGA